MAPKMLYKQPTELVGYIVLLWVAARLEMVAKTTSRRTHALFAHDHQYTLLFCPAPQSQAHEATFMQCQLQYAWEILVRECCYAEGYH